MMVFSLSLPLSLNQIIEERVKVTLPDDIAYALSDGVVLCHFINQIRPRAVQSIHVPSQAVVNTQNDLNI